MVFFSGFVNSLFPGVAAGVGEFEAASYLFQSDATSTLVGLRLGVKAVEIIHSYHPKSQTAKNGSGIGPEQVSRRLELLYPRR